jgi:acid phosphatase (class A)
MNLTGRTVAIALSAAGILSAQGRGAGGYLRAGEMPDMIRIAPPAPTPGSAQDIADRAIFRATRVLQGTPRWAMAQSDNTLSAAYMMSAFTCSAGVSLDARKAPRFAALVAKLLTETIAAMNPPKNKYQTKRPFLIQEGPTCVNAASLANNPDYPSGHTIFGWTTGLILAELEPDRAADIMVRARGYGENRVVCGLHNASAVEAGQIIAAALVAALHGSAAFRGDLEAARTEIVGLRAGVPTAAPSCEAEAAALATSPY